MNHCPGEKPKTSIKSKYVIFFIGYSCKNKKKKATVTNSLISYFTNY